MEVSLLLAHNTYTPVFYWLDLPLLELMEWVDSANKVFSRGKGS